MIWFLENLSLSFTRWSNYFLELQKKKEIELGKFNDKNLEFS